MFRKCNDILNKFNIIISLRLIGKICPLLSSRAFYALAFIFIIFIPSFIEGNEFFVCEEKSEFIDCRLLLYKTRFNNIGNIQEIIFIIEGNKFKVKRFSETCSGNYFVVEPCKSDSTDISANSTNYSTDKNSNNSIIYRITHFLLFWSIMILIAIITSFVTFLLLAYFFPV